MKKLKFEKRICKVIATNEEPYYKEVELRVFTYKNTEFGFNLNNTPEFIHIASGLGFNGNGATKLKDVLDSFLFREKTIGIRKFWKVVKNAPSLKDKISQIREEKILNDRKKKILKQLTQMTGIIFQVDRFLLMLGNVSWDICRTDDELKRYFGNEYPDDMSMETFIKKKFGKEALNLVNILLK